jgi:hypothetical protein
MVVDIDYFFKQCPLYFLDLKILYKTVKAKKRTQFPATQTNFGFAPQTGSLGLYKQSPPSLAATAKPNADFNF